MSVPRTDGDRRAAPDAPSWAPGRLDWVDAARGYSVAAVVVAHVVLWHLMTVDVPVDDLGDSTWARVYGLMGSARMPVLLAVSGLVLARRVRAGFREGGLLVRSVRSYYLYVVWLVVYLVFYALVRDPDLPHRVDGPLDLLRQLVVPETTLWYVYALAVYVAVLGALHRVPAWLVLTGLAVLCVVVHVQTSPDQVWSKVPELAIFFAVGVYGAAPLRRLADRASLPVVLLAAAVAAGVTLSGRLAEGSEVAEAVVFLARSLAFLVLTLLVVVVGIRWELLRRLGLALGRRTLPVYVLHPLWIALLMVLAGGVARDAVAALLSRPVTALLYPLVAAVVVIALCLATHRAAQAVRLDVPLFTMPRRWAQALEAPADRRRPADDGDTGRPADDGDTGRPADDGAGPTGVRPGS